MDSINAYAAILALGAYFMYARYVPFLFSQNFLMVGS